MELITLICPNSSSVWQGNGFSECFSNIIFGFGVNFVTLVLVAALGVTTRNARGSGRMYLSEKVFLHFLPALEACMSFFDMVFLAQRVLHGDIVMYDEWLFRCSQFLVWMIILVSSKKDSWCMIFCNRFLCFWWIAKSLLGLPHLQITFSSLQGLRCFEESCVVFLDIIFGIFVNINRIKRSSFERQYCSMDNPLLSIDTSLEEGTLGDSLKGKTQSYWHLLTFKAITSVMNHGVVKQLDFEDLLQLPIDMDPSSCHATLLSCWHAQQRHNCSNPSLFRAICCAYGWPYFRLGLLKVVNDCIGFVGPVLLNNLIRFLQQGSGNLDGYILAVAMGLIPIFKSFLDTQYTFHLSKLKLKLRSSIMTVIYHKIHTKKKRNRLEHQRLNALVYVRYNTRLRERSLQRKQNVDPILVEEIDSDDEWIAEKDDPLLPLDLCWLQDNELFNVDAIRVVSSNSQETQASSDYMVSSHSYKRKHNEVPSSGNLDGYILAVAMGLIPIFKSFLDTQYTFHLSKLKLKLRSSIMTVIYHKCLCVNLAERSKFSEGEIQTFMSVDADRIVNLCNSFHDMWSLPLQIGLALYLLYTQVKFAFVSGIAITILLIPVNKWISKFIARATEKMMKKKDERISKTAEILAYIRTLKMYGWELLFMSWLMEIRSSEVKHLSTRKYLDAWCVFFWATTPTLFSLFTFGLFTLMGYQLDAAMVFTCLALFNTLISPLNSFPWVINGLIDAIISTRRLSRFLSCSEHKPAELEQTAGSPSSPSFSGQFNFKLEDMAVAMYDASCAWSSSEEVEKDLVLHHVTLGLPKGSLVAIIGEVGSGKSSLLNSILKEMRLIHGSIYSDGSITYVPQVPWILSGTIRENILFGKAYDPTRYSDVLEACALDIDISLMVGGDMAYIGDKGVNLSGGQRARLALARAIYHGSDIFMLDDVLSAVDTQVARCILHNAILGPLMNQHTRVLCTHNIQAMSSADMIVVMDKGHVKWVGSSTDFSVSSYSTFCSLNEFTVSQVRSLECSTNTSTETKQDCKPERDSICVPGEAQEIIEVELRKEGRVELTVYKSYATYSGWFITVVICLSAILMQASRNGNDLWLSYWVDTTTGSSHTEYSTSFYLVVLCIFCVINSFLTLVRAFSFAFGGLRAAVQVHNTLLSKLINAPVHFFDKTPGGRILNRMSSDLYTIDDSLPFILNILLANIVGLLGIAIVLSYVQVVFLLLLLPFWYVYSKIQFYYRSTSRELRRLDSVSRSPIFASFTETLDGSSTIRAFKCEDLFFTRFSEHVALYQQTSYSELIASLWLSLRLQLLAALVISFVAMMAVIGSRDSLPISLGTPGLVGLALSYAAPIVSLLGSFLTSFTETEKEMVSVERVLQYMDIPQEELNGCQSLSPNWPSEGYIMFQNVSLRYLPSLPDALHDITFTISGGTQVGIIGRTGAGKSSILNALFRLTPICKGCILVDGLDIADVPVRDLRSHFAVVPQSPFLFEGSLRDNLDPFRVSDDLKIWKTLERCHVKEEVEVAGGLDIHVKESGTSFSVGQRQLLCLARALLKSSKVLCLDECTANIDAQTSSVLQNAILTECRGMTVITIAHRISTVLSMDNILILDRGILVEQGNPQVLLQDHSSRFSGFAKASTM